MYEFKLKNLWFIQKAGLEGRTGLNSNKLLSNTKMYFQIELDIMELYFILDWTQSLNLMNRPEDTMSCPEPFRVLIQMIKLLFHPLDRINRIGIMGNCDVQGEHAGSGGRPPGRNAFYILTSTDPSGAL